MVPDSAQGLVEGESLPTERWAELIVQWRGGDGEAEGEVGDREEAGSADDESAEGGSASEESEGGNELGAREHSQFTFDSYRAGQLRAMDFTSMGNERDIVDDAENAEVLRRVRDAVV